MRAPVLGLLSFGILLCVVASPRASDLSDTAVPIEINGGHVYVEVRVPHAKPLWFLVDSGAATPVNLIAKDTADRLGWKGMGQRQVGAIGGGVTLTFTPPVALEIGSLELPAERLAVIPLGDSASQEGHAVDGILGYAFFRKFNPEIDYGGRRMRLSMAPARRPNADAVPLRIVGKTAFIDANIELTRGQPPMTVTLAVDTGYDGCLLLDSPFVKKHALLDSAGETVAGSAIGGDTTSRRRVISSLRIGRQIVRNFSAVLSTDTKGAFSSADADGYVGGDFLRRYVVLFDYQNGRFALSDPSAAH
jgi:hypothetical protein